MRSVDAALNWLEGQRQSGSDDWYNMCESLCRQAYGLPAHYSSAELHASKIPGAHRYGHEPLSRGDLVLYQNGGYGHIVIATGKGADVYTNDYGGRGKVTITDARNLASWCGAPKNECYVADAWWSSSAVKHTHGTTAPELGEDDDDMAFIFKTHADSAKTGQGIGQGAAYLVHAGQAVQCDTNYGLSGEWPIITSPSEAMDSAFYKSVNRIKL